MTVTVIRIGGGGCSDSAADDGGADEARADAPAQAVGFGRSCGGSGAAGRGKGGGRGGGNLSLDRHQLTSVRFFGRTVVVRMCQLDGSSAKSVRKPRVKFCLVGFTGVQ